MHIFSYKGYFLSIKIHTSVLEICVQRKKYLSCYLTIFSFVSFIFVGCSTYPSIHNSPKTALPNVKMDKNDYVLTNNYSDHRAQQHYFNASGGKIAYTDTGNGDVLVMLHGVPTSSWMYRKMLPGLQQHFRIITIDLLGYGSSDKPISGNLNYTFESQAQYVNELLSSLSVKKHSLLFHDMGGLVGWELLAKDVRKEAYIDNVVILNTIISKHGFNHPNYQKGFYTKEMAKAYSNNLSSATILNMTFDHMGLTNNIKLTENECRGYVIPMKEGSDEALYEFFTGFNDLLFEKLNTNIQSLENFQGESLILWGAEDTVLTTEQLPRLQKVLDVKNENIHIFENNSHFLAEEIPDTLNVNIIDFMKE